MNATRLEPLLRADEMVREAATRAFDDLARHWHAGESDDGRNPRQADRDALLEKVLALGFADALPSPDDREAWPDAAEIIRAAARAAVPVDMAMLLATGDRAAALAPRDGPYRPAHVGLPAFSPDVTRALALGRVLQIGAAMEAALELSLVYVQDRKQFGQALARFQAIQHGLALVAEETAAAIRSLGRRSLALGVDVSDGDRNLLTVRDARDGLGAPRMAGLLDAAALVAGRGVEVTYDICHQVHGAIGYTREYALHRHSLDLLFWRDQLMALRGGELRAAEHLGEAAHAAGSVWRAVTDLMKPGA